MKAKSLWVGLVLLAFVFAAGAAGRDVKSVLQQSESYLYAAKFDQATAVLESALKDAGSAPDANGALQLRLQIAITHYHQQLLQGAGPGSVIDELTAVVSTAKALHNNTATGDALDALGLALHFKAFEDGNFDVASRAFKEAYALRKKSGDQRRLAESLFHLGLTYEHKADATVKDKKKANAYYQKSLTTARAAGDKLGMSYAYRHLAGLLQEAGKLDAALALFRKSQELRREIGFVIYLAPATGAIGEVYMEMKKYPEAMGYFKQAYEQARDAGLSRFTTSYEGRIKDAESKAGAGQ